MNQRILDLIFFWGKTRESTRMDKLYLQAIINLGKDASPLDEAEDELGCVDTVEEIYQKEFGRYIQPVKTLSTSKLYQTLLSHPDFVQRNYPKRGAIVISPTGYSTKGSLHGHVGICGDCDLIMSNDSRSGLWLENYSNRSWNLYFNGKLGFPVKYFHLK